MSRDDIDDPKGSATDGEQKSDFIWCGGNRDWMQLVNYWNMAERLERVRRELGHDSVEGTLDTFLGYYEMDGSDFHSWVDEQSENELHRCMECQKIFEVEDDHFRCSECQ